LPFSVNNFLEVLGVLHAHLSVVLLGLELELNVEEQDLGVVKVLGLLFETSIGEGLTEADTLDEEGLSGRATGDFLDADILLVEGLIELHNGIDDHLGEEFAIAGNNLGVEGGHGASFENLALGFGILALHLDRDLLDSGNAKSHGLTVSLDDDLRVHAFFNELFGLLEELTGRQDDGGGTVTDLVVLRLGNVDQSLGGGVHNVEESDKSSAIIGDDHLSSCVDKFVHTARTKSGLDDVNDGGASIDVRDDLASAFVVISSFLQDNNLGG